MKKRNFDERMRIVNDAKAIGKSEEQVASEEGVEIPTVRGWWREAERLFLKDPDYSSRGRADRGVEDMSADTVSSATTSPVVTPSILGNLANNAPLVTLRVDMVFSLITGKTN